MIRSSTWEMGEWLTVRDTKLSTEFIFSYWILLYQRKYDQPYLFYAFLLTTPMPKNKHFSNFSLFWLSFNEITDGMVSTTELLVEMDFHDSSSTWLRNYGLRNHCSQVIVYTLYFWYTTVFRIWFAPSLILSCINNAEESEQIS